jgi:hypothetical protein
MVGSHAHRLPAYPVLCIHLTQRACSPRLASAGRGFFFKT